MIPFTSAEFLRVFEKYNGAVWPGQVLIYLVGLTAIVLAFTHRPLASKFISLILALLWLWMGVVYHWIFFSRINSAAQLFAAVFVLQSLIFIFTGVLRSSLTFRFRSDAQGFVGAALITYAFLMYPAIGIALGHAYPAAPTFGLPCPTTIFTFGLLLGAGMNLRLYMLIIPMLWSLIGLWAALSLGMYEDLGLGIAALSAVLIMSRHREESGKMGESDYENSVSC